MDAGAATVWEFLRDMDYPTKRDAVRDKARRYNAPNDDMDIHKKLPEAQNGSAADMSGALGGYCAARDLNRCPERILSPLGKNPGIEQEKQA
jgi:hypothetical protein